MHIKHALYIEGKGEREILLKRIFSAPPEMAVSGTYRSIERPHALVNTERFDQQWYPGESLITSSYRSHPQGTELQITILYESSDARDTVLNSKTARGIANSYDRLEALLVGLLSDPGRS